MAGADEEAPPPEAEAAEEVVEEIVEPAPDAEYTVESESESSDSMDAEAQASVDATDVTENEEVQEAAQAVDEQTYGSLGEEAPSLVPLLEENGEIHVLAQASAEGSSEETDEGQPSVSIQVIVLGAVPPTEVDSAPVVPPIPAPGLPVAHLSFIAGPGHEPGADTDSGDAAEPAPSSLEAATVTSLPAALSPLALAATAVLAATTVLASASVTSGGSLGLASLKKFLVRLLPAGFLGLFTRLSDDELLDHPRRNEIVEFVRQNPGERLEVVRKALGLANGPMLHHLRILDQGNLVRVIRSEGMARLYPAGPRVQLTPYLLPIRRRVLEELRTRPGITQREIARQVGLSERVVSYHVGWLNANGLVSVERTGAAKRCFAAWPQTAPAPVAH